MTGTPGLINEAFLRVRLLATRIEGTSSIRVLLDSISTRSFVKQFLKIHKEARLKLSQNEE